MGRARVYKTNAQRQRAYRQRVTKRGRQVWASRRKAETAECPTPQHLFDALNQEFDFDTDVCASADNAKCTRFFTKEQNGLAQVWTGSCFMNPPYSNADLRVWLKKAYESSLEGATVVCLIPVRPDEGFWHDYCVHGEVRFIKGRVRFDGYKARAPFASAVVIFRPFMAYSLTNGVHSAV
jgi:phage N-6-adenine-methyltransferase